MSTVAEVISAVKQFTEEERAEFLARLREVEFDDAWDRQMVEDARTGKLDFLIAEADEAARKGILREGPGERRP